MKSPRRCSRCRRHTYGLPAVARSGGALDDFAADLLTNAATAVLDSVGREWVRTDGRADRARLLDRGFAVLRPTFGTSADPPAR